MGYVDYDFYENEYIGTKVTESKFNELLGDAEIKIDNVTTYKVRRNGLSSYSSFVQLQFKKAVCAQVDYFEVIGTSSIYGNVAQQFTVGKFSQTNPTEKSQACCDKSMELLSPTGLLYRGVDVCNQYPNIY